MREPEQSNYPIFLLFALVLAAIAIVIYISASR